MTRGLAFVLLFLGACIEPDLIYCADGTACSTTQVCSPRGGCVEADQVEQCVAPPPTGECTLTSGDSGACVDGVCTRRGCGNSLIEDGEACDDGNRIGGDGCSATCVSTEACGNGFLDSGRGEACDCGDAAFAGTRPVHCAGFANSDDPSAPCTPECLLRGCGDGERAGLEDCDGSDVPLTSCVDVGYYDGVLACLPTCRYDTEGCLGRCGDGVRNGPLGGRMEDCDGTDLASADCTDFGFYYAAGLACNPICGIDVTGCTGTCGDNVFDEGLEACDPSESEQDLAARGLDCTDFGFYAPGGLACGSSCQFDTSACGGGFCGDGIRQSLESCDGADLAGTTCTAFGYYKADTLACRSNCTFDVTGCTGGRCGDLSLDTTEQCDGSVPAGTDCTDFGYYGASGLSCVGCRFDTTTCTGGRCGDAVLNGSEQCDVTVPFGITCTDYGFYESAGIACSAACTISVASCTGGRCGDATINGPEQCDVSVPAGADCTTFGFYDPVGLACTSVCGFDTAACNDICGDDKVNGPETCDGAPAPNPSCALVGWDAGQLGCSSTCIDAYARCRRFGVDREVFQGAGWVDVFGVGADALVIGGNQVARRQPNGTWAPIAHAPDRVLHAIWGTSMTNVYVVGTKPSSGWGIEHFDGTSFSPVAGPAGSVVELYGISGASADDIWVVGASGTVLRYTGGTWSTLTTPIPTTLSLSTVWAYGGHAYIGGANGVVYHWNGTAWLTEMLPNAGGDPVTSISGRALDDIYAATGTAEIYRYDGMSWGTTGECTGQNYTYDVHANAAGVYAVGLGMSPTTGTLCQLAGGVWSNVDRGDLTPIRAIHGSGSALYSVGSGTIAATSGANTIVVSPPFAFQEQEQMGAWGTAFDSVYLVGGSIGDNTGSVMQLSGQAWNTIGNLPGETKFLRAVYGAKTVVVAVGNEGSIISGPGTWTAHASNTSETLHGVWGNASYFYAVGTKGTLLRQATGSTTWTPLASPTSSALFAVTGTSTGVVYAVGEGGTIVVHPGTAGGVWSLVADTGTSVRLQAVWARSPSDVWAVGVQGTVVHFDGFKWKRVPYANSTDDLTNVWGTTGDLFVTTQQGMKQFVGGRWLDVRMTVPGLTEYVAWAFSDLSFVVGKTSLAEHEVFALAGRIFRPDSTEASCDDFWDDDEDGLADCADPECATHPACSDASNGGACQPLVDVACGSTLMGETTIEGASRWPYYGDGCISRDERGREAFYRVRRTTAGPISVNVSGATADLDLIVSTTSPSGACTPDHACITADQTASMTPAVTFAAEANNSYIVIVDGYQTASSRFTLSVSCP